MQLINAQTDAHLWADTYDRNLTDIFGVESEIAKRIAESLQATLTGGEERALAIKSTNNPEAYDAYLRGLALEGRGTYAYSTSNDLAYKATDSYERAVRLDPNFAIAWARLSRADALIYFNCEDRTCVARREAAKRALENAQKLAPNSAETLLALVISNIWCCMITGLPKPRSLASAKPYRATAMYQRSSVQFPDARDTGMKALPTSSKPSPWIHVMWSY